MQWAVIATWKMALDGTEKAAEILRMGGTAADAACEGVGMVEDEPSFHSVGYGGRPDKNGKVKLDGGFMDGDTLHFGAVASIEGFRSPVRIARSLIKGDANNFLCAQGAEEYAERNGFEKRDNLTEEAREIYEQEKERIQKLSAYDGHDTVCFLALDENGTLCAATSTSGLFMKENGRIGDTPVPGNGFYADSAVGCAAATGMGEEIMKGALSYAAVMYMSMGYSAMKAAQKAVDDLEKKLIERNGYANPMSLIAMDRNGAWGVGTNVDFPFCIADELHETELMIARKHDGMTIIEAYENGD